MTTHGEEGSILISGMPGTDALDQAQGDVYAFPCSVVQQTCWFLEQISPGTPANNIAVRFRLTGNLHPKLLEQALNEIARRHEILRTRFITQDGEPKQLVEPKLDLKLAVVDLRADGPNAAELAAAKEARIAFDISKGPLWRARLLHTGPEEFVLLITIHHIIADGWSIGIITEEMGEIYGAIAEGSASFLPPLSIQYADYACWQREALGAKLEAELEYWKRQLHDFQPLCIPTDFLRPAKPENRGQIRSVVLSRATTGALKKLSDQQGCTLFMTMLAAFQMLMRHESGQSDIVLRTQTAGRGRVELEPLIGWFVNSLLLRVEVPGDASFLGLLKTTQRVVLEALDHQDIPFERVIEVARPKQDLLRHTPFQVNFIFQRDFVKSWQRAGVTFTAAPSAAAGTFADLNFFLVERSDGWRASVDVNTDVFRPETGDLLLQKYQTVLETVARNPRVSLSDIPLPAPRDADNTHKPSSRAAGANCRGPRDELEAGLLSIWKDVLGCDSLDVDTNFFDVGGHSLLAVRMLSIVQKRFGQRINLAELFAEPTVLAMARALGKQNSSSPRINVIPVQPLGAMPPLFMVGGDHWFRPLAKRLGPNQPFLGLSLMSYEKRSTPTSIEEIADDLVRVILLRKSGPLLLGGWCVDGAIAFEVARKLMLANHEVSLVVLIDSINPAYRRELQAPLRRFGRALKRTETLAREVIRKRGHGAGEHAWSGLRDLGSRVVSVLAPGSARTASDPVIENSDPDRQEFRRLLNLSENQYTPGPISCPVVLLRSAVSAIQDPDLGWKRVASGGLETIEIAGDHFGMFREPHVERLAAALSHRIGIVLHEEP
jgi:thioesterase domain-containing protein